MSKFVEKITKFVEPKISLYLYIYSGAKQISSYKYCDQLSNDFNFKTNQLFFFSKQYYPKSALFRQIVGSTPEKISQTPSLAKHCAPFYAKILVQSSKITHNPKIPLRKSKIRTTSNTTNLPELSQSASS